MTKSMLSPRELGELVRAFQDKDARVTVELRPMALEVLNHNFIASIYMVANGERPRRVYGSELFSDKAECERHAIRVANGAALTFGKCRDWDRYEFAVVTMGTK